MLIPSEKLVQTNVPAVENLPGLPVLPDEMRKSQDALSDYRKEYGIKFIDVNVLVDSSYKVTDFEFILELVTMKGNLSEYRGDRVHIDKKIFPGLETDNPRIEDTEDTKPTEQKNWKTSITNAIPSLLPLFIILIVLLLFTWMILRYLKGHRAKSDDQENQKIDDMAKQIHQIHEIAEDGIEVHLPQSKTRDWEEKKNELLESFIGEPNICSQILSQWVHEEGDSGITKAATLLVKTDEKLLEFLKDHFDVKDLNKLYFRIQTLSDIEPEYLNECFLAFKKELTLRKAPVADDHQGDIFNFLNQISDRQILHILKDENSGIVGVALAQIKPARAANLLHQMGEGKRREVLVSMGQLENVSIQSFKEVAKKLSRKALSVSNMRFVAADGTETIIDILTDMPTDTQRNYLNSITEMDIQLAEKIRNFFLPFEELSTMPAKLLLELLQDVSSDIMIKAFTGMDEAVLVRILQALPERMQRMLRAGIDANKAGNNEEIELSRKALVQAMRKKIKNRGGLRA
jgi:flagellar motor switch protein FliG